jgi:hypothetical protein
MPTRLLVSSFQFDTVHRRCVVEHVLQYHAVSRPEVGLQLRIGDDVEKSKKSIRHGYRV